MSIIQQSTAVIAGASLSVKDAKISQYLGLKITSTSNITIAGATVQASDVITFLQTIMVNTKITVGTKSLWLNTNLWNVICLSTDYHGMCQVTVDSDGDDIEIFCPIIQSDGQINLDWQIDITNGSAIAIAIEVSGMSTKFGNNVSIVTTNNLSEQLLTTINNDFSKLVITNNFASIELLINGCSQKIQTTDAAVFTNLNDEVIMGVDVNTAGVISQQAVWPNESGFFILDNRPDLALSQIDLTRVSGGPTVTWSTLKWERLV